MGLFSFLKPKQKKGCLYGKTIEQKVDFFKSLLSFYEKDRMFFDEQFDDLLYEEKMEFYEFVKSDTETKKAMLAMVNTIGMLLEEKHKK